MTNQLSSDSFGGVVGRTTSESTPWWPAPVRGPNGAPNVVFIVFDDVGFSDFGCYGSEIETPNIDRLAAGGLRYTNFHTTALCSPTRACLLTGRNHHSVGMAGLADWDFGFPGHRGRIARSAGTLAEMLRLHGYNTFAVGKWHLTPTAETSVAGPYEQWPTQRGFDRFYGFLEGETSQWHPELVEDNHHLEPPNRPGYHLTEDVVARSIELVRGQQSVAPEKPFFLYLCFGACHAPHHVPRAYIDKYVPVFEKGWDRTRDERLERQRAMGVVPPQTEMAPRNDHVRPWDSLSEDERRLFVRFQAAYAGMLEHTDQNIGRLLAYLQQIGRFENTLVVLLSDNGASQEGSPFGTVNALRYFNRVRDVLADNLAHIDAIGEPQFNNNYPLGWAMAGNTPLKRYKQNTHGGGVRDPLILHWPGGIHNRGEVREQFHHVSDITPTVLDVLGISAPEQINGVPQQPLEGVSLRYSFEAPTAATAKATQYFEMLGHRGIWRDGWKAVTWHRPGTAFAEDRWELYHVAEDFSECHDLAGEQPEKLRELVELWWAEAERYKVLPLNDAVDRWVVRNPYSLAARRHWVLYPDSGRIPHAATPDIKNRSYRISAEVELSAGCEGVLIAQGDSCGGYALYVKDGHLVHDYNFVGRSHLIRSQIPVPEGRHRLAFQMTKTGEFAGQGRLLIDDEVVAVGDIPQTYRAQTSFIGLEVGRAPSPAVSDFVAPFPFSGRIECVVIQLDDDQQRDPEAELDAKVGTQ